MCAVRNLLPASLARSACLLSLFTTLASASAWAQGAQQSAPARPSPPTTLPLMTYDEDAQYLAQDGFRNNFMDSITFIPLSHDSENDYLSFGFWIRERGEYVSNPNWSDHPSGNAYQMQRYFLHADLHLGECFRFFGELASSIMDGRNGGPRPSLDEEKMYVHQGFVDLGLWKSGQNSLTLRAGRQEVALGSQLLVSTRDGRNIRRSLDGARLTWVKGDWTVDLLAARPTLENADYFDNPPNHTSGFWAAYAVHPFRFLPRGNVDLYYMGLDNKNVPFNGKGAGREQRETIGTRLWGSTEHWDYNDEFTFQWGWFASGDIRAWAVSTEHGYRIEQAPLSPRFGLRAVAFSGDQNPSSHNIGTFNSILREGPLLQLRRAVRPAQLGRFATVSGTKAQEVCLLNLQPGVLLAGEYE